MTDKLREFYRLPGLAKELNTDVDCLLQMAALGRLTLSYQFSGRYKGIICSVGDSTNEEIDFNARIDELATKPDRHYMGYVNLALVEAKEVAAHYLNPEKRFHTNCIITPAGNMLMLSQEHYYLFNDLLVLFDEAERFREVCAHALASRNQNSESDDKHPKGGTHKSPLSEAVEYVFQRLLKSGNTELLQRGKIKEFMIHLKECVTEGHRNESDYVSERIAEVKKVKGKWIIIMQRFTDKQKLHFANAGKNETFTSATVSTILTRLRQAHNLPS